MRAFSSHDRFGRWPRLALIMLLSPFAAAQVATTTAPAPSAERVQNLRDLVEEVLDQKIENIQIADQPLPEALTQLGQKTGLRFRLSEPALSWMPYGERTRVSLGLEGVTLRAGLQRLFDGLGLSMRVEGDQVFVDPAPVLDRMGRRLTIQEVQYLTHLATRTWAKLREGGHRLNVPRERGDPQQEFQAALANARAPNALRQLEEATQVLGWSWVLDGNTIDIYPRAEDVKRRLERKLDLDYHGVRLDELLVDLGRRVGLITAFEPGVLERIQAAERRVDLLHRGTTVLQTLERLAGSTGVAFELTEAGVLIHLPAGAGADTRRARGRIVALLRIPINDDGTAVEVPFYEDNVPPEVQRLIKRKLPEALEQLRQRER